MCVARWPSPMSTRGRSGRTLRARSPRPSRWCSPRCRGRSRSRRWPWARTDSSRACEKARPTSISRPTRPRSSGAFQPVLDAIGDQPYYVGPIGAGSVAKLVHNCAGYAIQTALAEVFTMGVKAGVEPLGLWKAVRQGAGGRRRTFDGLIDQFLPGTFEPPAFSLKLAHKDVTLATALARELGVPMRMANLALDELTEALNRGWGARDSRVAMLLQEERAGVKIAVPPDKIQEIIKQDA